MNREQKRKFDKYLKSKGSSYKQFEYELKTKIKDQREQPIAEGAKVKLDIKNIQSDPSWDKNNVDYNKQRYQDWVLSHADDIFTVEYDPKFSKYNKLICLKEDDTKPYKWLFWIGDLIRINNDEQDEYI